MEKTSNKIAPETLNNKLGDKIRAFVFECIDRFADRIGEKVADKIAEKCLQNGFDLEASYSTGQQKIYGTITPRKTPRNNY